MGHEISGYLFMIQQGLYIYEAHRMRRYIGLNTLICEFSNKSIRQKICNFLLKGATSKKTVRK